MDLYRHILTRLTEALPVDPGHLEQINNLLRQSGKPSLDADTLEIVQSVLNDTSARPRRAFGAPY